MKKTTLFLCLISYLLQGQGLQFNDAAYAKLPSLQATGKKSTTELASKKVDLKPYCPTPQNQGDVSSCVGWAVGYGAMTIQYAIANDLAGQQEEIDQKAFSAHFIYNQIKENEACGSGSSFDNALLFVREKGNHLFSIYDKNLKDCQRKPSLEEEQFALKNRVPHFETLFDAKEKSNEKIAKVKASLSQRKPVVIGMEILENFKTVAANDKYWYSNLGNQNFAGGHAMVVVGFNDKKKAFELMNSYGKRWGKNGFCWVKYADFGQYCRYAAIISPSTKSAYVEMKKFNASVSLQNPISKTSRFPTIKSGKQYATTATIQVGDYLQLVVNGISEGMYLYAFSMDAMGKTNIHWPREAIAFAEQDITIPAEGKALVFEEAGTEYFMLLLSPRPIRDFENLVHNLNGPTIGAQLQEALSYRLFFPDASFESDQITIDKFNGEDRIAAVLYRFEVRE